MRLLIVGQLQGQLGAATKIAMDRGAKVTHAGDNDMALAELRSGNGADLVLARCFAPTSVISSARLRPNASAPLLWLAASAPMHAAL